MNLDNMLDFFAAVTNEGETRRRGAAASYHEAGHAVVAHILSVGIIDITMIAGDDY